jgi:hypothetical protein
MNKNEVHYGDLIKWVHKVIDSCQTREQIRTAERLIDNLSLQPQIRELDINLYFEIIREMRNKCIDMSFIMLEKQINS